MIRLAIAAVLFISVFGMMGGVATTWRENRLADLASVAVRKSVAKAPVSVASGGEIVQPSVPAVLPDLKTCYLFNANRQLDAAGLSGKDAELAAGNDLGVQVDMKTVIYSGSIIGDNITQAIITVSGAKESSGRRMISFGKKRSLAKSSNIKNLRVKEGDVLSGYTVASIAPEKIVFEKGIERVEKLLYDPGKKRVPPSKQSRITRRLPARPVGVSRAGVSALSSSRLPAVQRQARSVTGTTVGRRLVIPRRPPAKPDTSRVARRGRRVTDRESPKVIPFKPVARH